MLIAKPKKNQHQNLIALNVIKKPGDLRITGFGKSKDLLMYYLPIVSKCSFLAFN
jgi:hypothetical protein